MDAENNLVFVYGSLKIGEHNNVILKNSQFIFDATTLENQFDMIDLGSFPAVINGGSNKIMGEVYKVDNATLQRLDALEGNGVFYKREQRLVKSCNEDIQALAWIYILVDERETSFITNTQNIGRKDSTLSWRFNSGGLLYNTSN